MILYPNRSKIKKAAIVLFCCVLVVYFYVFYAEYSGIREVFINRIDESRKFGDTTLLFLSQNKIVSPFAWFSHDVDGHFLKSMQQRNKGIKLNIKQVSDAYYYSDTTKIIGSWYSGFRDKITNDYGIMINVGPIKWLTPFSIKVHLGVSGGPSHYTAECILTFNGLIWKINDWEQGPMTYNMCTLTRHST